MADADVLSAVSETLEARLTSGLSTLGPPAPVARLHDLVRPVTSDPPTITLFLYEISEEASLRNRAKRTRIIDGDVLTLKQPLALRLHYMITAWGGDRLTEQRMLGRVLQVMYDDATLEGLQLAGVLAGTDAELHVSLEPLMLEDRARVWAAIGQTYRLSVNYEVRVVNIDAETEAVSAPVRERRLDMGVAT